MHCDLTKVGIYLPVDTVLTSKSTWIFV